MKNKVAFFGPMASGKSYLANYLASGAFGYEKLAFADELKRYAQEIFDVVSKDGNGRQIYQQFGEAVRKIDDQAWIRLLEKKIVAIEQANLFLEEAKIVIDDVRYPNEFEALAQLDFQFVKVITPTDIRLERIKTLYPNTSIEALTHISETALNGWKGGIEIDSTDGSALDKLVIFIDGD